MAFSTFTMLYSIYFWTYLYVLCNNFQNIFESAVPLNMVSQRFLLCHKFKDKKMKPLWQHRLSELLTILQEGNLKPGSLDKEFKKKNSSVYRP